jgi:hypothetical protein
VGGVLGLQDRQLGWLLGLGDIGDPREICAGYAHACRCTDCLKRADAVTDEFRAWLDAENGPLPSMFSRSRVALPWEVDAA